MVLHGYDPHNLTKDTSLTLQLITNNVKVDIMLSFCIVFCMS